MARKTYPFARLEADPIWKRWLLRCAGWAETPRRRWPDGSSARKRNTAAVADMRSQMQELSDIECSSNAAVQSLAETIEGSVRSPGVVSGYGPGESLVVAHRIRPEVIEPLVHALREFEPTDYLATYGSELNLAALDARKVLFEAIREVLATYPKPHHS